MKEYFLRKSNDAEPSLDFSSSLVTQPGNNLGGGRLAEKCDWPCFRCICDRIPLRLTAGSIDHLSPWAAVLANVYQSPASILFSFRWRFTVTLNLGFGRPLLLSPDGSCEKSICLGRRVSSILATCPAQRRFFWINISYMDGRPACSRMST